MLSVPTLWTAFIINFLALGLIWAYVTRSYPKFEAAPFWTASAFAAAFGASLASLRILVDSLLPLLAGGTVLIFASCLAAMGIRRFYDRPVGWRQTALITGLGCRGHDLLRLRLRQHADPDVHLFGRPGAAVRADPETVAVAGKRPRQPRRPARGHRRHVHHRHLCHARARQPAACRRRVLLHPFHPGPFGFDPGADVPVDVVEFRLPADGDGPAAQRGRRPRAARRSHRRRQPAASAAAPDRGMRALGAQRPIRSRCW